MSDVIILWMGVSQNFIKRFLRRTEPDVHPKVVKAYPLLNPPDFRKVDRVVLVKHHQLLVVEGASKI